MLLINVCTEVFVGKISGLLIGRIDAGNGPFLMKFVVLKLFIVMV